MSVKPSSVLVIYTGGTIGMVRDADTGSLVPVNYERLQSNIQEISRLDIEIDIYTFDQTIDSSNIQPEHWVAIVEVIEKNYGKYDGFVVLHGSDTMAFTASALSFMIENLSKPVILTGSQLPIGVLRSDARENFITALEIAAMKEKGVPRVSEVCIYFEYHLLKGNRTTKFSSSHFNAFSSANYPSLAESGVQIAFNESVLRKHNGKQVKFCKKLCTDLAILKIFPGMSPAYVKGILGIENLKAVVLETFGSGNAPTELWFVELLAEAIQKGIIVVNITQCTSGMVLQGKYKTSEQLREIGVISGFDMTTESALTKLMYLLGNYTDAEEVKLLFSTVLREEMSPQNWD